MRFPILAAFLFVLLLTACTERFLSAEDDAKLRDACKEGCGIMVVPMSGRRGI